MGLEEEAVFYLLQRATSEHQIRSAFTRGSVRGSIYVEGILDAEMISFLNSTPGIIRKQSGVVRQNIDPSDWVKLLTMQDPTSVVEAGQWIRVLKGAYKGDLGFVTRVESRLTILQMMRKISQIVRYIRTFLYIILILIVFNR